MPMTPAQLTALRAVLPDTEQIYGPGGDQYLFSNDELNAFFDELAGSSVKRTAGYACRALGNTDLLVLKYIRVDERTTDGARTAAEWRQAAKQFFDEADNEDTAAEGEEFFDLVTPGPVYCAPELAPWPVWPARPWGY
jgi:hypothetical protein